MKGTEDNEPHRCVAEVTLDCTGPKSTSVPSRGDTCFHFLTDVSKTLGIAPACEEQPLVQLSYNPNHKWLCDDISVVHFCSFYLYDYRCMTIDVR